MSRCVFGEITTNVFQEMIESCERDNCRNRLVSEDFNEIYQQVLDKEGELFLSAISALTLYLDEELLSKSEVSKALKACERLLELEKRGVQDGTITSVETALLYFYVLDGCYRNYAILSVNIYVAWRVEELRFFLGKGYGFGQVEVVLQVVTMAEDPLLISDSLDGLFSLIPQEFDEDFFDSLISLSSHPKFGMGQPFEFLLAKQLFEFRETLISWSLSKDADLSDRQKNYVQKLVSRWIELSEVVNE